MASARIGLAVGCAVAVTAMAARGECARPLTDAQSHGGSVGIVADESVGGAVVDEAIRLWRGCANYARSFPEFTLGVHGGRTVTVRRALRPAGIGVEHCGSFSGSRIVLYDYWIDAAGTPHRCGSLAHNLAHELGHVLGLDDAPPTTACADTIMAGVSERPRRSRGVQPEECQLAGQKWITGVEDALLALQPALGELQRYRFAHARFQ